MIDDLTASYESDSDKLFNHIENRIASELYADEWKLNFQPGRKWQQYYKRTWQQSSPLVHYEFIFSRDLLFKDTFSLAVDVEKGQTELFIDTFSKELAASKSTFDERGITFRPSFRTYSVAYKKFMLDKDSERIADQIIAAMQEFSFLTPIIDEAKWNYEASFKK